MKKDDIVNASQKYQSLDENIHNMIDKLLMDSSDEEKKGKKEHQQQDQTSNLPSVTPVLFINNVPVEQKVNHPVPATKRSSKKKMNLGINMGVNLPTDENLKNFMEMRNSTTASLNKEQEELINMNIMQAMNMQNPNVGRINLGNSNNSPKMSAGIKFNQPENFNPSAYSSATSINSYQSVDFTQGKLKQKKYSEESSNKKILNDTDDILENRVKLNEKVDEESVIHLKGNFLKIVKSQNGSRILQKSLNKTNSHILSVIFEEIKFSLPELMVDPYANYFCQRFYDFLEQQEKVEFLNIIKDHVVNIGNSTIGTYPLQAIIDQMKTKEERRTIIEAVKDHIMEMSQHVQGTHVIEKIIICFEEESIKEIYETVINNFLFLACHCNGLCVTKKIVSCCKNASTMETLYKLLFDNAEMLVQNTHGNYSIQSALDAWDYEMISPIIALFYNKFFSLSMQKFSSNVVEKCLERGGETVMNKFMDEVCHKKRILELMKNPFGNYVIQKALKLSTGFYKGKMGGIIKKHLEKLNDKKLVAKWKYILQNLTSNNLGGGLGGKLNNLNGSNQNSLNILNLINVPSRKDSQDSISPYSSYSPRSQNSPGSHRSVTSITSSHSYNPPSSNTFQNLMFSSNSDHSFINHFSPNMPFKQSRSEVNSPTGSFIENYSGGFNYNMRGNHQFMSNQIQSQMPYQSLIPNQNLSQNLSQNVNLINNIHNSNSPYDCISNMVYYSNPNLNVNMNMNFNPNASMYPNQKANFNDNYTKNKFNK